MKFVPLLFSAFLLSVSAQTVQDAGLTVVTQQGPVAGTQVLPTVRQFLGIPFATAKRWQAPQLPPIRRSIFQATHFADSCLQQLTPANVEYLVLSSAGGINVTSSEDCMSVHIWAPSVNRKQKTAVMIWIHGGGGIPTFDGTNFVRDNDDLTIVTFNYRLNIFGQPHAPQLGKNNINFGLLDIDVAVQWVHANIANFGGDQNRIVLFGQSAGAVAADAYTFSHPHDTIVKGVIEQSGRRVIYLLDRLKQKLPVGPDRRSSMSDATIFADTPTRAANGSFLRVPLLGGTVANEDDIFMVAQELITVGFVIPVATELISDIITTIGFTCPAGVTAIHRNNADVPTWRYQYQGVFPDISIRPDLRAFHSSEIPMVFGTYNASGAPATSTQIALSRYMQSAWVAFARDPIHGLLNFGWPLSSPDTTSLAQLGNFFNQTGVVFTQGTLTDFVCNNQTTLVSVLNQLMGILSA
ncbi:carboxylesterase [Flammula alnicola]|nr:carboxylesterase [Flammula alnicola]